MNFEGLMDAYPQGVHFEKPPNESHYEETFSFYQHNVLVQLS